MIRNFITCLFSGAALSLSMAIPVSGQEDSSSTSLDHIIYEATRHPAWKSARHQVERLTILRDTALQRAAESDPVSDRYVITALAGPVDLVRFFGLARIVCSGKDRRASLLKEWQRENGGGKASNRPLNCTPEDLPSNALGALFGEEIRPFFTNQQYDITHDLREFFKPLQPVPESKVRSLTFERAVLGLPAAPTNEQRIAAHSWTSAMPAYLIPAVAPDKVSSIPDAASALKAAGLELRMHQDLPIILERQGTAEPAPRISKALPVPERPAPIAKPARKPVSKAVPVE